MRTLLSTAPVLRAGQDPLPHEGLFNRSTRVFLLLTALFALAVCGGSLLPQASALHVPGYLVALLGKYLTYALLALSVDLIWGYMGVLSLGHGAFFALGGYAFGMYLMRQIGARGVYGNPDLPESPPYWPDTFLTGRNCPGSGPAASISGRRLCWWRCCRA